MLPAPPLDRTPRVSAHFKVLVDRTPVAGYH